MLPPLPTGLLLAIILGLDPRRIQAAVCSTLSACQRRCRHSSTSRGIPPYVSHRFTSRSTAHGVNACKQSVNSRMSSPALRTTVQDISVGLDAGVANPNHKHGAPKLARRQSYASGIIQRYLHPRGSNHSSISREESSLHASAPSHQSVISVQCLQNGAHGGWQLGTVQRSQT